MKILIVGGGGREHAIADALSRSRHKPELYCAPGNAGIARLAKTVPIKVTEFEELRDFALNEGIDLIVVGPDDPLAAGIVDVFEEANLRTFGPKKNAAILEGSKAFAKDLANAFCITVNYQV